MQVGRPDDGLLCGMLADLSFPGATGLIRALADDYLKTLPGDHSIEWVCNHSRNTQLALKHGYIDLGLTYERDQEEIAIAEGWSLSAGCVFHDHFLLAGPISDPANVRSASSVVDAFSRIASSKAQFLSRVDGSATMWKEQNFWAKCSLSPWEDKDALASWYRSTLFSPSEALAAADAAGAYLLIDRSTLLRQTMLYMIHHTTVFFEPTTSDDILMNSCYVVYSPKYTSTEKAATVMQCINYLFSSRGQHVIASFGKKDVGGFPLFMPNRDGFATSFLCGGRPRDGRWRKLESRLML